LIPGFSGGLFLALLTAWVIGNTVQFRTPPAGITVPVLLDPYERAIAENRTSVFATWPRLLVKFLANVAGIVGGLVKEQGGLGPPVVVVLVAAGVAAIMDGAYGAFVGFSEERYWRRFQGVVSSPSSVSTSSREGRITLG